MMIKRVKKYFCFFFFLFLEVASRKFFPLLCFLAYEIDLKARFLRNPLVIRVLYLEYHDTF